MLSWDAGRELRCPLSGVPVRRGPWELPVPECPALHACSDRSPWRVPARAGAQSPGQSCSALASLALSQTLPALLVPAAGDPARPEPCPGAASGRKNRPLHASSEDLCLAQGHTLYCLRAMKPESRWTQGKKDHVGVGSWPWLEGKGGIQLDSSPGSCQAPTILQRPIFISGCCGDPYQLLRLQTLWVPRMTAITGRESGSGSPPSALPTKLTHSSTWYLPGPWKICTQWKPLLTHSQPYFHWTNCEPHRGGSFLIV